MKHFHGYRERLRQRMLKVDGAHFTGHELLELRLCAFVPDVDVKPIANGLIAKLGSGGDPIPSRAGIELTREIDKALTKLERKVHDHVVVGAKKSISMKAKRFI
ncbi:MAG: JAB domain-containing protein [Hyphomonadaceae bacterium]